MAVPKRKTSKSRRDKRRATHSLEALLRLGYKDEAHIVLDTRRRGEYDGERNWAMDECRDVCSLA